MADYLADRAAAGDELAAKIMQRRDEELRRVDRDFARLKLVMYGGLFVLWIGSAVLLHWAFG